MSMDTTLLAVNENWLAVATRTTSSIFSATNTALSSSALHPNVIQSLTYEILSDTKTFVPIFETDPAGVHANEIRFETIATKSLSSVIFIIGAPSLPLNSYGIHSLKLQGLSKTTTTSTQVTPIINNNPAPTLNQNTIKNVQKLSNPINQTTTPFLIPISSSEFSDPDFSTVAPFIIAIFGLILICACLSFCTTRIRNTFKTGQDLESRRVSLLIKPLKNVHNPDDYDQNVLQSESKIIRDFHRPERGVSKNGYNNNPHRDINHEQKESFGTSSNHKIAPPRDNGILHLFKSQTRNTRSNKLPPRIREIRSAPKINTDYLHEPQQQIRQVRSSPTLRWIPDSRGILCLSPEVNSVSRNHFRFNYDCEVMDFIYSGDEPLPRAHLAQKDQESMLNYRHSDSLSIVELSYCIDGYDISSTSNDSGIHLESIKHNSDKQLSYNFRVESERLLSIIKIEKEPPKLEAAKRNIGYNESARSSWAVKSNVSLERVLSVYGQ